MDNITRQCFNNKYDLTFTASGASPFWNCPPPIQCAFYFTGYTVTAPQPYGIIKEDCYNASYYNPNGSCNFSAYVCACNGVTYDGPDCAENAGYPDYSFGECTAGELVQFTIKNIPSGSGVTISIEASTASPLNYTFPPYTCSCPPLTVTAGSNSPRCTGATLQLQASASNITGWQWSGPGGFTSTQQNPTRSNATAAYSGIYTVTVTNSQGCTGTASTQATVLNPVQITNIVSNNLIGNFRVSGGLPQNNGSNYASVTMALQGNPAVTATLTTAPFVHNETVSFSCPQPGIYTVTATDGAGCNGTATISAGVTSCTVPGTPTLTKAGHTYLDLAWSAPNPGAVYAYEFRWRETGTTNWQNDTLPPSAQTPYCNETYPVADPPANTRLSGLKPCTSYDVQVRKLCNYQLPGQITSSWSGTGTFSTGECGNLYYTAACSPAARTPNRITLSQFGLGAMNDTTGYCQNCAGCWNNGEGYLYQSGLPISLQPGQTYNLSYTVASGSLQTTGTLRVWLDMNRDRDFDDSGELIRSQSVTAGSQQSVMVTIPANATVGVSRLRVVFRTDAGPNPCTGFDIGAVRDYPVYMGIAGCNPVLVSATSNTPVCHADTLQLQTNAPAAVAWQWYGPNNFNSTQANPLILNAQALNGGTYTVVVADNLGCTGTATTTVEVRPAISIGMLSYGFPSGAFTVDGGSGNAYPQISMTLVNFPNIQGTLTGAPFSPGDTVTYNIPTPGVYQISVTDNLGCTVNQTIDLTQGSGVLPPPCPSNDYPGADLCSDICIFCNFNGYTGTTVGYSSQTPPGFCGTIENEQWFGFVAGASGATFTAVPSNCEVGNGVQIAIYQQCSSSPIACSGGSAGGGNTPVAITTSLTPGVSYFVMIDGYAGDQCDFTLNVDPPSAVTVPIVGVPGNISGPVQVCPGAVVTYLIPPVTGAGAYIWFAPSDWLINGQPPPVTFSAPGGNIVQVIPGSVTGARQICVQPKNACGDGNAVCKTINIDMISPTILPPATVCAEDVPYTLPWGQEVSVSGTYENTYTSYQGCDSVVRQTVTVKPLILKFPSPQAICAGDCLTVCGEQFCDGGSYSITCESYQGCDSIVNFSIIILEPVSEIIPNPGAVLSCDTPSITLNAAATPGTKIWKNLQGVVLGSGNSLTVKQADTYVLTVTASAGGNFCVANDTIVITGVGTPQCPSQLISPAHQSINVPVQASLTWAAATPCVDGYRLTLSTTPGGNDLLNNFDVGNVTSYQPAQPLPEDTIYVRIVPYNDQVMASGCQAYWFVTSSCPTPAQADFSFTVNGLTATFTNTSGNGVTYEWDFGDGFTSTLTNPVHTYQQAGVYTVSLTVTGTCDADTRVQVLNTAPVANFAANPVSSCAPLTVQFGNLSSVNTTSFIWQFPGGMPASSSVQNPVVVYNAPGTYTVTLIAINPVGRDTLIMYNVISAFPGPTAGFNSAVNGKVVAFTNTSTQATSYSWNFGDGFTSAQANPSHTYGSLGTYTVCLTATGLCGSEEICKTIIIDSALIQCADPNWFNFISNDCGDMHLFGGLATGEPPVYCDGQTVRIENNSSPAASIQTTYIDWGDGICEVFAGSPVLLMHNYNIADTCLNVSDGEAIFAIRMGLWWPCANGLFSFNFLTIFVTVQVNPVAKFSVQSGTACPGQPVQFTNLSCKNGASATYLWDFGDGTTSALENPGTHIYGNSGIYEVKLQVTNDCATSTYLQNITIGDAPSAVGIVETNTCPGQAVGSVSASAIGGIMPYQFLWNNGQTNETAVNLLAGAYTVTVTDAAGCMATATATVNAIPGPAPSTIATTSECGLSTGAIDLTIQSGTPGYTFLWNTGSTAEDLSNLPAGTYTVTVTDAAGCTATASATVANLDGPNASAFPLPTTCGLSNGHIDLDVQGGAPSYSYLWSNGATAEDIQDLEAGTYTVTVSDAAGCTAVATAEVDSSSPLEAQDITETCLSSNNEYTVIFTLKGGAPPYVLLSGSGGINANQFASQPIPAGTPYTFSFTDAAGCGPLEIKGLKECICTDTVKIDTVICKGGIFQYKNRQYDQPGMYTDFFDAPTGCDTLLILALEIQQPEVSINGDDFLCQGEFSLLTLQSNNCTGCTYQWSDPALSGIWGEVNPSMTTIYSVTATDQRGCSASGSITVRVQEPVTVPLDFVICPGGSVTVCDQVFSQAGTYTVACPCDSTVILSLDVITGLYAVAYPDTFSLRANQDEATFAVAFNDSLTANSAWIVEILTDGQHGRANPEPDARVHYRLTDTDFHGIDSFIYEICHASCPEPCDTALAVVIIQNEIPNAFSPDNDGYNDTFDPFGWHLENDQPMPVPTSAILTIWNRWNEVVFYADPYPENGWDGRTSTGKRAPQGTYYYTLQMTGGETELIRGVVQVLVSGK